MQTPSLYHLAHRIIAALVFVLGSLHQMHGAEANVPAQLTLEPGAVARIAITGSLPLGGDVSITVRYNPSIVQIAGARGAETYALRCVAPSVSLPTVTSATSATVTIQCPFSVSIANDTLVVLELQGVMGIDSVGVLGVDSIAINGEGVPDLVANECQVRRNGGVLGGYTIAQGITGTYPNPFRERTRIVYVMRAPGTVRCALRTYQGRIVTEIPPVEATAGENAVELAITTWEVAAGAYVVTLTTDEGTYYHPVTVMK